MFTKSGLTVGAVALMLGAAILATSPPAQARGGYHGISTGGTGGIVGTRFAAGRSSLCRSQGIASARDIADSIETAIGVSGFGTVIRGSGTSTTAGSTATALSLSMRADNPERVSGSITQ